MSIASRNRLNFFALDYRNLPVRTFLSWLNLLCRRTGRDQSKFSRIKRHRARRCLCAVCHCRFHIVTCCLVFKEHHRSVDLINRVIIFVLLFIHLDRERDSQSKICNYNFYLFAISFCLFVGLCERDKTLIYDMKVLGLSNK